MNELIVVAFDQLDDARDAMKRLRDLEGQGRIAFEDTAIRSHHQATDFSIGARSNM